MTAAQRRLLQWSKMTSKQKLADMEAEDRRRKKMLRASAPALTLAGSRRGSKPYIPAAAAQPLYHEKP